MTDADRFPDVGVAAVAILRGDGISHAGVFYRDDQQNPTRVVHFGRHNWPIEDELAAEGWQWMPPHVDIDQLLLDQAAAMCQRVAKNIGNRRIPYGFAKGASYINGDGLVVIEGASVGLSCSTFVMILFERVRIFLLDAASWQPRDDDEDDRRELLPYIALKDPTHASLLTTEVDCLRFRPMDVVAAFGFEPRPMSFERVNALMPSVARELRSASAV